MQLGYLRTVDNIYFYEDIIRDSETGEMLYKCRIKDGFVYIPDNDIIAFSKFDVINLMDRFSVVDASNGAIIETFDDWAKFRDFVANNASGTMDKFGEILVPKEYGASEYIRVVEFKPDHLELLDY